MSIEKAIRDAKRFTTAGGFNVPITVTPPGGGDPVIVQGIPTRHVLEFDAQGYPINSTNAHVLFSESALTDAGFTVRNADDVVALENFLVSYVDGTNVRRTYKIIQTKPSETLGLIVCIIGRYGTN